VSFNVDGEGSCLENKEIVPMQKIILILLPRDTLGARVKFFFLTYLWKPFF